MREGRSGKACGSNRLILIFPVSVCSTLKSFFHFAILKLKLRESHRRSLSSHAFFWARSGPVTSGSACAHTDDRTHTCTQNGIPCPEEELETGFNEKTRHSVHQVSVLASLLCTWMVPSVPAFVCTYSSSIFIPPQTTIRIAPGSSPEHPVISLIQAQRLFPLLCWAQLHSLWGPRITSVAGCSLAVTWEA